MIRPLRLARIALEAEALRVGHQMRRAAGRIAFGYLALIMVFCAFGFLHLAGWFWLRETLSTVQAAMIFTGVDLLVAAVFVWLALRSSPGAIEREALAVRRRALEDAEDSLAVSSLLVSLVEQFLASRPKT